MTTINGEPVSIEEMTVSTYLAQAGFAAERVVVELNLEILPKDTWDTTVIKDGDRVEILNFVGGG